MNVTMYDIASRYLGMKEVAGHVNNPAIVAMLQLVDPRVQDDETAWCSAFMNTAAFLLDLPRSKSLAARSWLTIGTTIALADAKKGYDVVVLKRGLAPQPGPDVIAAPGHVGLFDHVDAAGVWLLAGNQGNAVSIEPFDINRVLGVRRLYSE